MLDPFVDFFLKSYRDHRHLHSFPTRRSSDLIWAPIPMRPVFNVSIATLYPTPTSPTTFAAGTSQPSRISSHVVGDRKSTRLNSSHGYISYAVFCLKKKKKKYT